MRLLSIFLFSLSILSFSCKNSPAGAMQQAAEMSDLPKDFLNFYQQFHTDSSYQIAHIEWPLKGEKSVPQENGTAKTELAEWEPETWVMLHLPDMTDVGLRRSFETISNVLIIEKLQYPMVNFGLERQFFKDENEKWMMIYYAEMQELN